MFCAFFFPPKTRQTYFCVISHLLLGSFSATVFREASCFINKHWAMFLGEKKRKKKSVKVFMNRLSELTIMQTSPFSWLNTQKECLFTMISNVLALSPTKKINLKDKKQICVFIFTFNNACSFYNMCSRLCTSSWKKKFNRGIKSWKINCFFKWPWFFC